MKTVARKKDRLRRELDTLEWNFMEATLREQGRESAIAELKRASATHRKPFFLWRLHFGEVFQQRGGFDVVIANPPYVRQEEIKEFKPAFKRTFECFTGTADLFVYFYERGVKLLRDGGALALITSNKYYRAGYGEKLRGFLARELTLHQLIDFGDAPVFEAIALRFHSHRRANRARTRRQRAWLHLGKGNAVRPHRANRSRTRPANPARRIEAGRLAARIATSRASAGQASQRGQAFGREYVNRRFYNGVKTGLNEAFLVDPQPATDSSRKTSHPPMC